MKRKWDNDELTEHWSIDVEERAIIMQKKGANRLGFALLLKFFQLEGRFPDKKNEFPRVVQVFVAEQLGIPASLYQEYNWQGRSLKYHRAEIRVLCGFRPIRLADFDELRQWLINSVLPQQVEERPIKQMLYGELKARKIEPPTIAQVERLVRSAQYQFEINLCAAIVQKWPTARCPMVINAISVLLAIKPFVSHLIVSTIVVTSALNKFVKCCKRIVRAVAYGASVARVDLPTTRS